MSLQLQIENTTIAKAETGVGKSEPRSARGFLGVVLVSRKEKAQATCDDANCAATFRPRCCRVQARGAQGCVSALRVPLVVALMRQTVGSASNQHT